MSEIEYLPFGESVELIKSRQPDATLQSAGLGMASIRDLASAVKIRVVAIPKEAVSKVGSPAYVAPALAWSLRPARAAPGLVKLRPGHTA